jgi:1-acyl-sn-glycerol-3-phosphate acyltransferase
MSPATRIRGVAVLRSAFRATGFGALTLAYGAGVTVALFLTRGEADKPRARDAWTGGWSHKLLSLFDVKMSIEGNPGSLGAARARGRVVIANHRSIIDIAVMLAEFGGAVLSRGDLATWPIIGRAAKSAGTIFVDRKSKSSGARAMQAMADRLAAHDTITLFPEGTTFEDDVVRPFKPGAFVAAMRAGTPVLPVGLAYPLDSGAAFGGETFLEHLARLSRSTGTTVYVDIGDEMSARDGESVEAFGARCQTEVQRLVDRARARERVAM